MREKNMTGSSQRLKVKLEGGGPWGFRLQGGPGTGLPLTVSKVRRKSKAYNNLREGDVLVSVNGLPCDNLTYDQVMTIADKTGAEFNLEIERKEDKVENSAFEIKPNFTQNSSIQPMKTTMTNKMVKVTETKTTVTEKCEDLTYKKDNTATSEHLRSQQIPDSTPESLSAGKSNMTESANESKPSESELTKSNVTSDISTKTSSEVTPTGEKYEKLETEKLHEKNENQETTIIRTDYEEVVKSHTTASSPPPIPKENRLDAQKSEGLQETSYDVHKTENTEIMTAKMNGFTSTLPESLSTAGEIKVDTSIPVGEEIPKEQAFEVPFATQMNTVDTCTEIDENSGTQMITKKKKMFSSSSFYEEPYAIYPTVEEQFEMAKKIAESLADDTNKKSKGANMFFKRAKRSTKWIHEGPEPSSESGPDTPEILPEYPYTEQSIECSESLKKFPKLKLVLDPRHPVDLASLRSTGHIISEHNVVSPEVCHELVRDLESPVGKGSAMFAKRKKKSSEWVVDEEKVKALMKAHERELNQIKQSITNTETSKPASFKSPWDTPLYGRSASPLTRVNPDQLAETVIAAADVKRRDSIQSIDEPRYETCRSPIIPATPAASYYNIYTARAPKGWSATIASTSRENYSAAVTSSPLPYTQQTEPFPTYASLTAPSYARKFNFQNFNTLPRKWKSHN